MQYPELAAFDSTTLQHAGLAAVVAELNARRATEGLPPYTTGGYLVAVVAGQLDNMADSHVTAPQRAKLIDAFDKATDREKADAAAALKVDLSLDMPAEPTP